LFLVVKISFCSKNQYLKIYIYIYDIWFLNLCQHMLVGGSQVIGFLVVFPGLHFSSCAPRGTCPLSTPLGSAHVETLQFVTSYSNASRALSLSLSNFLFLFFLFFFLVFSLNTENRIWKGNYSSENFWFYLFFWKPRK
jgi:hypothetical protein